MFPEPITFVTAPEGYRARLVFTTSCLDGGWLLQAKLSSSGWWTDCGTLLCAGLTMEQIKLRASERLVIAIQKGLVY